MNMKRHILAALSEMFNQWEELYDHHQEHFEKLLAWLQEHGDT
jgi:hypothetical protein